MNKLLNKKALKIKLDNRLMIRGEREQKNLDIKREILSMLKSKIIKF
jgi:hypothetical protein